MEIRFASIVTGVEIRCEILETGVEIRFARIVTGVEIRFKNIVTYSSILLNMIDAVESHGVRSGQIPYSGVSMLVVNGEQ